MPAPALVAARRRSWHIHAGPGPAADVPHGRPRPAGRVTLIPYYETHHQRYNLYWSVYTPEEWQQQKSALAEEQRARAARTPARGRVPAGRAAVRGRPWPESANSRSGFAVDRAWRDAADGWFSFVLKVDPVAPVTRPARSGAATRRGARSTSWRTASSSAPRRSTAGTPDSSSTSSIPCRRR